MSKIVVFFLILVTCLLIIEMIFMYKLARLIAIFLNRFRYIGNGQIHLKSLQKGQKAPLISAINQYQEKINILSESYKILLFKDLNCGTCKEITKQLENETLDLKDNVEIIAIQREVQAINSSVSLIFSNEAFEDYNIENVPTIVIVNPGGTIYSINNKIGDYPDFIESIKEFINK
ncbi:hypothetical protein [Peribacillus simplex]|uniref:hypothetical protein n=1 Tax=Peribacillus simplex TaxID=1478 RepID=UPI0036702E22